MMKKLEIYIEGQQIELNEQTIIAQTLKRFTIENLNTRSLNFTNTFKIPLTENNQHVYQHANNIRSDGKIPYQKISAKILQSGLEVISDGVHNIVRASDAFEVYILSNAAAFFEVIGNKKLSELNFIGINGSWADSAIENYRLATSGIVAPVMDYGNYNGSTNTMDVAKYLPSIYYHTLIEKIFTGAGYQPLGAIFTDAKYLKQIVAYSRPEFRYDEAFVNTRHASARVATSQSIPTPGAGVNVVFGDTVIQDETGYWNGVDRYIVTEPDPAAAGKALFAMDILVVLDITVTGVGTVDIDLLSSGSVITLSNKGTGVYTINSKDFSLGDVAFIINEGSTSRVRIKTNSGTPSVTVNAGSIVFNPLYYVGTGSSGFVYFNHLMPDILQKDLIKDFLVTFGLIMVEKEKNITCKSFKEIIQSKSTAKDWTQKRSMGQRDNITFIVSEYAQNNYFRYTPNEDAFNHSGGVMLKINKDTGLGIFTVPNENLPIGKTIYESPFSATLTEFLGGIMMARIPVGVVGSRQEFNNEPGMRKLLVRNKYSYEPGVYYFSLVTPKTDYLVAYFESPDESFTMSWQQFLTDWYTDLIASLQNAKIVTRSYMLDEIDILSLDFLSPVFDTDSYYLINEVKNFVPGKLTQVELFKIS